MLYQIGLEKYIAFTINNNLVLIENMQLVKNLSDNDFKYLAQEFSGDLLELAKQKGVYPYKYVNSFKNFLKINCLIDLNFLFL